MKSVTVKSLFIFTALLYSSVLNAGSGTGKIYKFWVELQDKNGSTYSILRPWDFLSQRSIMRRQKAGTGVTMADLPVVASYVTQVQSTGVKVLLTSRWMNAVLVSTPDSTLVSAVKELNFVKAVSLMGVWNRKRSMATDAPDAAEEFAIEEIAEPARIMVGNKVKDSDYHYGYGLGWSQISMMRGEKLHKAGYRGAGVYIAVLDAGFYRANRMQAFDSLFESDRYLGSIDLVDRGTGVFEDDDHGTQVLSCMASNVSGIMIGTAPDASYLLIRTEDAGSETLAEEAQWLCGAEYADSCGVDIISSSLGYTEFDDDRFGHTYSELDGHTTLITRAANMAWDRGIVVVNSAGNEGDEKWKYIGAPADADGVIAVGAVDEDRNIADFSSVGPTADGRVKPDLVALGKRTTIINSNGYYIRSNGTSFSAPVLAGSLACLLQAGYNKTPDFIRKVLMLSSASYLGANNQSGRGLPDFEVALEILMDSVDMKAAKTPFLNWPDADTLTGSFDLKTLVDPNTTYMYKLKNHKGKTISQGSLFKYEDLVYAARMELAESGEYHLEVNDKKQHWKASFYFAAKSGKK